MARDDANVWFATMMSQDGTTHVFTIERDTIELGRSFSEPAVTSLLQMVNAWIGTRVMRRWDATDVPPTVLTVTVEVVVA
jgi:hypothetical protein